MQIVRSFDRLRTGNTSKIVEGWFTTELVEVSCFVSAKRLLTMNGENNFGWRMIMKRNLLSARILLILSLPLATTSFAMNPQPQAAPQPDVMNMLRNVWGLIQQHPIKSALIGGGAALLGYKLFTSKFGKQGKGNKNRMQQNQGQAGANQHVIQGLAYIMQHAQQALQLYQAGNMPRAYLYGKYCEIAEQTGLDALPQQERMNLFRAVLGFDVAFSGKDYESKRVVGLQAAVQAAAMRLQQVVQQLHAKYGDENNEPRVKMTQQGKSEGISMVSALMDQVKANPISTLMAILSSGYSLLAQFNGWPPFGPAQPQPAFANAPESRHTPQAAP